MSTKNDAESDLAHADIGIVAALPIELAAFVDRCDKVRKYTGGEFVFRGGRYDEAKIAIVESGMGFARARRATQALVEAHTPKWLLSCGFSGALLPDMKIGHIVMANSICDVHGHDMDIHLDLPGDPAKGLHVGRIVTADELVRTVEQKQRLAERFGAIAVDLESLAVAQVAKEHKLGFMAVRTISDDMSADVPSEVLSVVGPTGSARFGAALGAIWKRPSSVKDMWRLRESASSAAEGLAVFLDGVVVQLFNAVKESSSEK